MEVYIISISVVAGIYAVMALGLNVMWGMAGLVNLGLVGSAAVGAYTSAILTKTLGLPIWAGIIFGTIAAAIVGAGLAMVTRRLKDHYLAIVTLGFAETIRIVASNEIWLTNGTDGISGIPGPFRADLSLLQFNLVYLGIVVLVLAALYFCCQRILYSPFGRVLRAVRDDDVVVSVAGKNMQAFKVQAFALGSGIIGLAGGLYAHYTSFISPELFVPLLTLYIKLSLLVGGVGNNRGAVLGAAIIIVILEGSRFVIPFIPYITPPQGAAMRELFLSATLLIVLRFRVTGLIPEARDHPVVSRFRAGVLNPQNPTP